MMTGIAGGAGQQTSGGSMRTRTHRFRPFLIIGLAIVASALWIPPAHAQYDPAPAPGPYYFVSDTLDTPDQFYWRGVQSFGGIKTIENLNLLAAVLGDTPPQVLGSSQHLVPVENFNFGGGSVTLQPFAYTKGGSAHKYNLWLGPFMRAFLNDPLGGPKFDLTLPFSDGRVALSDRSAIIRSGLDAGVWHTAVDFDVTGGTSQGFDVVAPADGLVEGTTPTSSSLAIRHTAFNGRSFLTIYQHLVPESKAHLTVGAPVVRGQILGHVQAAGYTHLHFGVAVAGPSRTIGGVLVPAMWYLIDPFGVYDYRRDFENATSYNYVPKNTLAAPVQGVVHASVWRTDPPIGSLLLPEDCESFNPDNLTIVTSGSQRVIRDGAHTLFTFSNGHEALTAGSIIRYYRADKACMIGRPGPSFQYLLVGDHGPQGSANGEDCLSFDPSDIGIEPLGDGRYVLKWEWVNATLFVFPNMLEAGNALSTIRKYGFSQVCYVGRPDPSFQYMKH